MTSTPPTSDVVVTRDYDFDEPTLLLRRDVFGSVSTPVGAAAEEADAASSAPTAHACGPPQLKHDSVPPPPPASAGETRGAPPRGARPVERAPAACACAISDFSRSSCAFFALFRFFASRFFRFRSVFFVAASAAFAAT